MDMDRQLAGNYGLGPACRQAFQDWLNQLWIDKDENFIR